MSDESSLQDLSRDSNEPNFRVKNSSLVHFHNNDPAYLISSDDSSAAPQEEECTQDFFSDSSSVIFLDEFTKCDESMSPQKKIKLEMKKANQNSPSFVLPSIGGCSKTRMEFSQNNSSSPVKLESKKRKKSEDVIFPYSASLNNEEDCSNSFDARLTTEIQSIHSSSSTVPKWSTKQSIDENIYESCTTKFVSIKRLTREDLEKFITNQMVTVITSNKKISDLEEKLEATEKMLELSKDKSAKLAREVTTLNTVLKSFMLQVQNSPTKIARPPKKMMRSVGVQVRQEALLNRTSKKLVNSKVSNTNPVENEGIHSNTLKPSCSQSLGKNVNKSAELSFMIDAKSTNAINELEKITEPFPPLPQASKGNLPADPLWKPPPPKLELRISKVANDLHFCWNGRTTSHAEVKMYCIWGYLRSSYPSQKWEQLAEFPPDRLPMSCRISAIMLAEQCKTSELCFFIIKATDIYGRDGPWSDPEFVTF